MKLIRQPSLVTIVTLLVLIVSCDNKAKEKHCVSSYELNRIGDTVNSTDCNGKQGIWIPTLLNKLQDTVYYKNDTVINL